MVAQGSKDEAGAKSKGQNVNGALLGIEKDQWPEFDANERLRFHQIFERVLSQLEPVVLAEQQFCVTFFQLDIVSPTSKVSFICNAKI